MKEIEQYCVLGKEEEELMKKAFSVMELTARSYHKVLKTARTIADLEGEERIRFSHLSEALGYRTMEHKGKENGV